MDEQNEASDVEIRSYDSAKALDDARKRFASMLFWLLAAVLAGGLALITTTRFTDIKFADAKDLFLAVFTAILATVSTAVGYYFGKSESGGRQ